MTCRDVIESKRCLLFRLSLLLESVERMIGSLWECPLKAMMVLMKVPARSSKDSLLRGRGLYPF